MENMVHFEALGVDLWLFNESKLSLIFSAAVGARRAGGARAARINKSEVGGVSSSLDSPPNREIVSFRSCVRCEAACARAGRCCFRGWAAEAPKMLRRGVASRRPCPSLVCWLVN